MESYPQHFIAKIREIYIYSKPQKPYANPQKLQYWVMYNVIKYCITGQHTSWATFTLVSSISSLEA